MRIGSRFGTDMMCWFTEQPLDGIRGQGEPISVPRRLQGLVYLHLGLQLYYLHYFKLCYACLLVFVV
jgi:hypothetical protein